jgi:hypothetical protein
MTQEMVEMKIWEEGGKYWLQYIPPAELFDYLMTIKSDGDRILLNEVDNDVGWMILVDVSTPDKKVLAIYYEKGEMPIFYSGWLKEDQGLGWILVDELSEVWEPLVVGFLKKVLWGLIKKGVDGLVI